MQREAFDLEHPEVLVRRLRPDDLEAVIDLDRRVTGRRLGAELEGAFVGFLLSRVYYGEFGEIERAAVLDTMGVHPDFQRRCVGSALIDQLRVNLLALGIRTLHTEVGWDNPGLMVFFNREGFEPAPRYCLDLDLERTRRS